MRNHTKRPSLRFALIGTVAVGAALASGPALAGGPETLCDETPLKWHFTSMPPAPVSWYAARDGQRRVVPGYTGMACLSGQMKRKPGAQSYVRAAATWTKANLPGLPVLPGESNFHEFKLVAKPTGYLTQNAGTSLVNATSPTPDGMNVVTAHEPPSTFLAFGASGAVALSDIRFDPSTGEILEVDIAVNALETDVFGSPIWAFVEKNDLTGLTHVSSNLVPAGGYADLEGVVAHQFGHFAGLAHSLVDSEYDGATSLIPAMFPIPQVRSYSAFADYSSGGACSSQTISLSGSLLGESSRTLEWDDLSAIGTAYPKPFFDTQLGAIEGEVRDRYMTSYPSVHVVAIKRDDPETVRVGRLQGPGKYRIDGLPAGEYFVLAEPIDGPGLRIANPSYFTYFPAVLPRFASLCSTSWGHTTPDFYSGPALEFSPVTDCESNAAAHVASVFVTTGATTSGIDIQPMIGDTPGVPMSGQRCANTISHWESPIPLWVSLNGFVSTRGMNAFSGSTLGFLVSGPLAGATGGACYSGEQVKLRMSTDLVSTIDGNELWQLGTPVAEVTGTLGLNQTVFLSVPSFPPAPLPQNTANIFVQAEIGGVSCAKRFSNVVNVKIVN